MSDQTELSVSFLASTQTARTVAGVVRDTVGADFGVPAKYNEEAQNFVDYMVYKERERCAKLVEDMEALAGAVVHDIARAIRNG